MGGLALLPLQAGEDVEGAEDVGQLVGGDEAFLVPGSVGLVVQPDEQAGGGDALGLAVVGEGFAQFIEQSFGVLAFALYLVLEDEGEGFGGAFGPASGEETGDLEQRLDEILAAGIELNSGRKVLNVKGRS